MSIPQPLVPLKDHCSLIYQNTLYTYQADAFQSLPLQKSATWSQLPQGVPTTGSTCILGSVDDQPSLIVLGGKSDQSNYAGLQHFMFASKSWITDKTIDPVLANRQGNGATFLSQSSHIFSYGGSQDQNPNPSSQTFAISTKSPYATQAFNSQAPPVIGPLVLPFNGTHALMLGGGTKNTELWTFNLAGGWHKLGPSLPNPLKDSSKAQASLVNHEDGSKVLQIFDFADSPNAVTSVTLYNATSSSHSRKRAVDNQGTVTAQASQDTRSGFSLASDPATGLVVVSGGNSQAPLAMYNQTSNSWIDASSFFDTNVSPTHSATSVSTSATASATFTPSAAPSTIAAANEGARDRSLTIVGGVLGGVVGAAVLFALILLALRTWRRRHTRRAALQRQSSLHHNKEDMDFVDIGNDMSAGRDSPYYAAGQQAHWQHHPHHQPTRKRADSSLSKSALLRHQKSGSVGSGKSFWSRGSKSPDHRSGPQISAPILNYGPPQISAPALGPPLSRSIASPDGRGGETGWSRYFSRNASADDLAKSRPSNVPTNSTYRPDTFLSTAPSASDYTNSRVASSFHPHESAEVAPLKFQASHYSLAANPNTVSSDRDSNTGFAFPSTYSTHYPPPPIPTTSNPASSSAVQRPHSIPSIVSDIEEVTEDGGSNTDYRRSEGQESWGPISSTGERNSNFTDDAYNYRASGATNRSSGGPNQGGESVAIPNFPMPSERNSAAFLSSAVPATPTAPLPRPGTAPNHRSIGLSSHPNESAPAVPGKFSSGVSTTSTPTIRLVGLRNVVSRDLMTTSNSANSRTSRASTVGSTQFPGHYNRARADSRTEDLSWLNLGNRP